jgi:hypothetical protein
MRYTGVTAWGIVFLFSGRVDEPRASVSESNFRASVEGFPEEDGDIIV